ncbi:TPA: hypothetical protein QDB28_004077 [Burkholderia vietnamiensis]|nr:hypothetical protein [Burkholderia vietnamiensis]
MAESAKRAPARKTNAEYVKASVEKKLATGAARRTFMLEADASAKLDQLAAEWGMSPTKALNEILRAQ